MQRGIGQMPTRAAIHEAKDTSVLLCYRCHLVVLDSIQKLKCKSPIKTLVLQLWYVGTVTLFMLLGTTICLAHQKRVLSGILFESNECLIVIELCDAVTGW
jgi:hypothetical protein